MRIISLMGLTHSRSAQLFSESASFSSVRAMAKIREEDKPFIDDELNSRIEWVVDDVLLHDETFKTWEHDIDKQERMHLSELGRICQNFSKSDFAAVVITAMENYPLMVMQIAAEYIQRLKEGERQ